MLNKSFCSSPWFHMRIGYNGDLHPCRWGNSVSSKNIKDISLLDFYNSNAMCNIRKQFLNGETPSICNSCYYQDAHGKLSGRIKQLTKSGIKIDDFALSARSTPHYNNFLHSHLNNGKSDYYPVDFQIDLGNVCNSACIMCDPEASSKLSVDYKKLHKSNPVQFYNPTPYASWTSDPALLNKFLNELNKLPDVKYIQLLGGETLYDPAFYKICNKLIESNSSKNIIVGTTTNGTIYDHRIENIINHFKEFHLGISIETVTALNDYIRYPSDVNSIIANIKKFLTLRKNNNLHISLRITPNIFTIYEMDQLLEFMIENNITAESCNILTTPSVLRIELLPDDIRQEVVNKLKTVIEKHNLTEHNITNTRRNDLSKSVIGDIAVQYLHFIENYTIPTDVESQRFQLVTFLKSFESIRNNSIIDYAPRYTEFLRSYGY